MSVPVKGSFIGTDLTNRMNLVGDGRSGFIAGSRRAPDHQGIALAAQYNMHCTGRDTKRQANEYKYRYIYNMHKYKCDMHRQRYKNMFTCK